MNDEFDADIVKLLERNEKWWWKFADAFSHCQLISF